MKHILLPSLFLIGAASYSYGQTDDAVSLGSRCLTLGYEEAVTGSARYSAMAGARMAIGEDISTIRENPAGLGLYTEKSEISITPDFTAGNESNKFGLANAGAAFVLGNNHKADGYTSSAIGLSYHRLKNFSDRMRYNDALLTGKGSNAMWSAGYGINIGNRYFFGLGINIITGSYELHTNNHDGSNSIDTKTTGWNVKAGTVVKLTEDLNLALALHSPSRYNFEETRAVDIYESIDKRNSKNYNDIEYHQWGPLKLAAGIGWHLGEKSVIDAEYSYQDFRALNVGNSYDYFNDVKDYVETNMRCSHTIRVGFESELYNNLKGRLGTMFTTSPADTPEAEKTQGKDIGYGLNVPHQSLYVCAGAGYRYNWLYADLAYVYKNQKTDYIFSTGSGETVTTDKALNSSEILLTIGARF